MARYGPFGLCLVAERELPGFGAAPSGGAPEWKLRFVHDLSADGPVIRRADEQENPDRLEMRRPRPDSLYLSYADGTRFLVDAEARVLSACWKAPLTFEDMLVYLVGPVLGAVLRLERRSVLHASAVEVKGEALVVMGEAGAGKSTLAAALVERGCRLITEDVAALAFHEGGPSIHRGAARIKLWDESVIAIRGRRDALPPLVPSNESWTKKYLDASTRMVERDLTPIGGVLALARDSTCQTARIEELSPQQRMLVLIANGYAMRALRPDDREADLARLGALARHVPVRKLVYPDDLSRLPDVVDALVATC